MTAKGKVLTLELVFNKTKSDNLASIKNLNLWGNDLEDLQLIDRMPNLEVISLSVNKIASLRDFAKCNKLQVTLPLPRSYTCARTV
jgi:cilla- and flagella-associated protein